MTDSRVRLALSIEIQEGMTFSDTLAMTRSGEALGFESSLLAEHYYPSGVAEQYSGGPGSRMSADAWVFLAALARETKTIRLGTLVSPVTFRHPAVLAKMAATLDHVSDGRAELGIGAGWFAGEHAAFGFPFPDPPRRVDLVEEQLQLITGLWNQDPFSYHGQHYDLVDCHFTPKPVQQPRPTIIVGGSSTAKRLVRLAARYADEYVITLPSLEQCRAVRARLDEAGGKHVRLSVFVPICLGETEQQVEQRFAELRATNPQYLRMMNAETGWLRGTPAVVQGQLAELSAAGVARALVSVNCDLHREMLPLLRG
jgi:alkanesulfonate monooxygenase SsuD/methylene tetrahydromethanopterin reductase-like flavin-dependent oxidoreductase (luciferase family)